MDAVTLPRENMLAVLKEAFPDGVLLTGADEVERYTRDWSGDHFGLPLAVARPRSVDEVSALMRCCSANAIPVVPQGGLTGLVGAASRCRALDGLGRLRGAAHTAHAGCDPAGQPRHVAAAAGAG